MTETDEAELGKQVTYSPEEKIVFYHIASNVDEEEAMRLHDLGKHYLEEEGAEKVLIDLKASTEFSSSARKIWVKFLQNERIQKAAIFGGNVFVRTLASFVIAATGKENIRFFPSEEEARSWLSNN